MKIRLALLQFWKILFYFCIPIEVMILGFSIVQLVFVLVGNSTLEEVKDYLLLGLSLFIVSIITDIFIYLVWRFKNPSTIIFNKNGGVITLREEKYEFFLKDVLIEPNYDGFFDFIVSGHPFIFYGTIKLTIWTKKGTKLFYEIGLSKRRTTKLIQFIDKCKWKSFFNEE